MDDFKVISQCYKQGQQEFSAQTCAPIMGVTVKTAKNYLSGKTKPDKARLQLLRAVLGQKIIPQDAPLWYNEKKHSICTDTGHSFDYNELNQLAWFRMNDESKIQALKEKVKGLQAELLQKLETITALQAEKQNTAPRLPDNVILFPTQYKDAAPC